MDLEKDQFGIALSHPTDMSIGSSKNFNTVNVIVDVKKISLMDKINLHMKTSQLIVNDLTKTNAMAMKVENMLGTVLKQLKLEKANARALTVQNDELKKIIVNIGVDPSDKTAVQKFMQSAEVEISTLRKKLKFPTGENSMVVEVAEVENEKEKLLQQLMQKYEEISKIKKTAISLQNHIDNHSCTFVFPIGNKYPQAHIV